MVVPDVKITALKPLSEQHYKRCPQCDLIFQLPALDKRFVAYCPRCHAKICSGYDWSMIRLTALAVAVLLLMPLALGEPLIRIRLLGTVINASLLQGVWQMAIQGDPFTASMVAFCAIGAPLMLPLSLLYLRLGHWLGMNLRPVLLMLNRLKEWIMLDVYLVGLAVACIKVQEYADINVGPGLYAYIAMMILVQILLIRLNIEQLWERYYPVAQPAVEPRRLQLCCACNYTGLPDHRRRCPRCHITMSRRAPMSLQKTWAALIAAIVFLFPANLMPISILYVNGERMEDTIFSGVISLATSGNMPVAIIVFIASILVPFTKVLALLFLLCTIHLKIDLSLTARMRMLRVLGWIGRWSMLDLFVIALMMSLVNREQLLSFTMGPAAFYFGAAVFLTILAVEWLDSRLLWDAHATRNTEPDSADQSRPAA